MCRQAELAPSTGGAGRGTQSGRTWSQGRIAVGGRRSAISPREPVSSPRRHREKEGSTKRGRTSIRVGSVSASRARSRLCRAVGAVAAPLAAAPDPPGRGAAQRPAPEGRDAGRRRGHPRRSDAEPADRRLGVVGAAGGDEGRDRQEGRRQRREDVAAVVRRHRRGRRRGPVPAADPGGRDLRSADRGRREDVPAQQRAGGHRDRRRQARGSSCSARRSLFYDESERVRLQRARSDGASASIAPAARR